METYDKPTVTSSSTDQDLTPAHYSRETRRNIAKNLRNIATVTLLVALLYHYAQVADVFSTQMRLQQGGTTCNASTTQAEPEFDWYDASWIVFLVSSGLLIENFSSSHQKTFNGRLVLMASDVRV